MFEPIRFYFDFVSTYSYFALERFAAIAETHGREIDWRIVSLPHVLKANDMTPPPQQPRKFAHNQQDIARLAAMLDVRYTVPKVRPLDAALARLVFYRVRARDPAVAFQFALAVMRRYFGDGEEVRTLEQIAPLVAHLGVDADEIATARGDPGAREALHGMLDLALADGMFGAPYACVDGQRFWGQDRVTEHLDWHLGRGRSQPTNL